MTTEFDPEQIIRDSTAALRRKFTEHSDAEVEALVREELGKLQGRPVQDYLSVLTERAVKQRLKQADKKAATD